MDKLRSLDIKYLKGIGPSRAELLGKQLGIKTYYDLLYHFPTHYVDRSQIYKIKDLHGISGDMPSIQLRGRFVSFNIQGEGAKKRLIGAFSDGSGLIEAVWFNSIKHIQSSLNPGAEYIIFGKPTLFQNRWSIVHPEVDTTGSTGALQGLRGVYPLTEQLRNRNITSRTIFGWEQTLLASLTTIKDTLPQHIIDRYHLPALRDALICIHNPRSIQELHKAQLRLKFEELFFLQLNILRYSRKRTAAIAGFRFTRIGEYFNSFYKTCMPFELTNAQKRVIKEIRADVGSGRQMNRLLQGDVGSGKTLVALMCMLMALDNGTQACLMAPTEILATQHYETISQLVAPIGVNVKLLTGSTRKKERESIHLQLQDGTLHILIGTHAVIEDNVQFKNLGLTVIDEQHRFGVAQRARLWRKNAIPPHVLVMTATPIPRTLAMTVYGDLDVSIIDELPPGRKPVQTLLKYEEQRFSVYQGIGRQLKLGRQAYIVYPLIKESEKSDLKSLEEGYELIRDTFPQYKVAFVHGQMKPAEKDYQMNLFASHKADILVATTVIEVGVNVPNASIMVIENAERFGLSQLHQLRGRVGRGADQSYCILMSKYQIAKDTRKRLEIMTSTTDGFIVAEADLKMRGPGDIEGTLQSGLPMDLKIANLATDGQIVQLARDTAENILAEDPDLTNPVNARLVSTMNNMMQKHIDWSRIS